MCHTNWHGHVRRFSHTRCNILNCPSKPSFNTNNEFLRHFNKIHTRGGEVDGVDDDYDNYDRYDSDYAK